MFWSSRTCVSGIDTILKWGQLSNQSVGDVDVAGREVSCILLLHLMVWSSSIACQSADTGYQLYALPDSTAEQAFIWLGLQNWVPLIDYSSIISCSCIHSHLLFLPFIYLWCLPWSQSCVNSTDKESRLGPNVCNPFQLWLTWYPWLLQHALLFSHMQAHFAYIVLDIALLCTLSAVQWSILPLSFLHYPHTHAPSHLTHTCTLTPHTTHLTLHTVHPFWLQRGKIALAIFGVFFTVFCIFFCLAIVISIAVPLSLTRRV